MKEVKHTCPCCGYTVTGTNANRCPRCNHILWMPRGCNGDCRKCAKTCGK